MASYGTPLKDYPSARLRLRCWNCALCADYQLHDLVRTYGFDTVLMTVLQDVVDCRWYDPKFILEDKFCGAFFPDLFVDPPPPPTRPIRRFLRVVK